MKQIPLIRNYEWTLFSTGDIVVQLEVEHYDYNLQRITESRKFLKLIDLNIQKANTSSLHVGYVHGRRLN